MLLIGVTTLAFAGMLAIMLIVLLILIWKFIKSIIPFAN